MKIFVCCSKHFYHRLPSILNALESQGHAYALPNSYAAPMREEEMKLLGPEQHVQWKGAMLRLQLENVAANDAVLVVNYEKNNQPNYIGGATFLEMFEAWRLGKLLYLLNPIPKGMLADEIKAMQPVILDGDISNLEKMLH